MKLRNTSRLSRVLLSTIALGAIGGLGVLTTSATFTDSVSMAQVTVQGGTLDLKANGGDGPNQAWSGTISATVTNMKPGDEASGTVQLTNSGTLPFTATVSSTGVDAGSCYSYYFRETAATGATKAASWPVNIAGAGTAAGADGTTANFTSNLSAVSLQDNGSGDLIWETDDVKTYTLTVRMKTACATAAQNGTLNFTVNATQ